MDNLATILSKLMSERGIKSAELARKTGIGQPVIYRLMTGTTDNPQIQTLKPIADFFGVTIDQLLGYASLSKPMTIDNITAHNLHNKLTAIKTIASVFNDLLPILIDAYKKAAETNLVSDEIQAEILPLLLVNCSNLLKATNYLQEVLSDFNKKPQD